METATSFQMSDIFVLAKRCMWPEVMQPAPTFIVVVAEIMPMQWKVLLPSNVLTYTAQFTVMTTTTSQWAMHISTFTTFTTLTHQLNGWWVCCVQLASEHSKQIIYDISPGRPKQSPSARKVKDFEARGALLPWLVIKIQTNTLSISCMIHKNTLTVGMPISTKPVLLFW